MSRVPYHALGRPYSGAHGRFKSVAAPPVVETAPVAEESSVVAAPPAPPAPPVAEDPPVFDQVFGDALSNAPAPVAPEWDPMWTKARLAEVAIQKGLPVTLASTKADIIAALTAAG